METVTAASQLRNLLLAHDKAVFQIYALDLEVCSLMKKMTKQVEDGHIIHGIKLVQRRCVLEGVKEMFSHYRHNKWREVQDCISTFTEFGQQQHTGQEDLGSDSRAGDQYISSDRLQEDQPVGAEEHQLRGDMLEHGSQMDMEDQHMHNLQRWGTGLEVWRGQQENSSQQHQGQDHQVQHEHQGQDHQVQNEHQGQDHQLQNEHQGQDHQLQHEHQGQDHQLQLQRQAQEHLPENECPTGLFYWNHHTVARVEEDMENSISSDNESSMDLSYEDDFSEQDDDDGSIYCHGSYNPYMVTITRGLCLENCELHRCA